MLSPKETADETKRAPTHIKILWFLIESFSGLSRVELLAKGIPDSTLTIQLPRLEDEKCVELIGDRYIITNEGRTKYESLKKDLNNSLRKLSSFNIPPKALNSDVIFIGQDAKMLGIANPNSVMGTMIIQHEISPTAREVVIKGAVMGSIDPSIYSMSIILKRD
ncbi:hypothetical protein HYY74_04520 [Candidatus Woesearchaeota archaeon]|nr:hypothetical protein [Candidatus Woesearchaeota archaeon]